MKVVHVITGLDDGGAEAVLYRLCKHDSYHIHRVVSLGGVGKYGPVLKGLSVEVTALNMAPGRLSLAALYRLVRLLRQERPDVVQTWMYHGDFLGGIAARLAGIGSLVWGVHHTTLDPGKSKKMTIRIAKVLSKLSWWVPARIVACAERAMDVHEALGYDRSKMRCIPNGYDLSHFCPSPEHYRCAKANFISAISTPLIGAVGRFNPQKDHLNLLNALARLKARDIPFHCVLVGTGLDESNTALMEWIADRGLADCISLLGQRMDVPEIMNALDLHILSSAYGEAFPNVVAESMACGTPCVVTDVGDAGEIVGDTGWVVAPRDADALAAAIETALEQMGNSDWTARGRSARSRIQARYSIDRMVESYARVWAEAAGERRPHRA